jgi:hypothetical protein
MFSIEIGMSEPATRHPRLRLLPKNSGDFDRAVPKAAARTLNAPMIVDFPELLGPTATFIGPSEIEKSRRVFTFRNRTEEIRTRCIF